MRFLPSLSATSRQTRSANSIVRLPPPRLSVSGVIAPGASIVEEWLAENWTSAVTFFAHFPPTCRFRFRFSATDWTGRRHLSEEGLGGASRTKDQFLRGSAGATIRDTRRLPTNLHYQRQILTKGTTPFKRWLIVPMKGKFFG